MALPDYDITVKGGRYEVSFPGESIVIRFERIKDSSDGLKADLIVLNNSLPNPHVHEARLNTQSTTTINGFCRKLDAVAPNENWESLIHTACVLVKRKYREGEPAFDLATLPPDERVGFRVDPLIHEGQPNILFGPGGLGKSYFATYLAHLVSGGTSTRLLTTEPGNVLYLDWESDRHDVRDRVFSIASGLGTEVQNITYRFCTSSLQSDYESIETLTHDKGIDFIIVDSAAPACGGSPEKAEDTLQFFNALRGLQCTSLVVAHVSKAEGGGKTGPFGSVFWTNLSRNSWEVRSAHDGKDNEFFFSLWHRKTNRGKLRSQPLSFRVEFTDGATLYHLADITESDELASTQSLRDRIRDAISRSEMGSLTVKEISVSLDQEGDNTIYQSLLRDYKKGRDGRGHVFQKLGEDRWGLATTFEP